MNSYNLNLAYLILVWFHKLFLLLILGIILINHQGNH